MLAVLGLMFLGFDPSVLTIPPEMMVVPEHLKEWTVEEMKNLATEKAKEHHLKVNRFLEVIDCESGWNPDAEGDFIKGKPTSFGLAQFHYPERWGLSTSSAKNPQIALETMAQAWEDDRYSEWSCWRPG